MELNIVKVTLFPKLTYRFNPISIKILSGFCSCFFVFYFAEIDKHILKFIWKGKYGIDKMIFKKNTAEGLTLPRFKTYYKAAGNKTGMRIDTQINGIEFRV